jgi:hypothetical protein
MAARYYVLVSQELLDADPAPRWEDAGLHLIEQGILTGPGTRLCRFLDDGASEDMEGKSVELSFARELADDGTARAYVSERRVIG